MRGCRYGARGCCRRLGRRRCSSEMDRPPHPSRRDVDLDAAALDADGDGLLDLVIVGTQLNPFYDGWFVQLLMNRGDGTFADETSLRLQPHEQSSGNAGVATDAPWAMGVDVLDFNGDGAADFVMSPTSRDLSAITAWPTTGSGSTGGVLAGPRVGPSRRGSTRTSASRTPPPSTARAARRCRPVRSIRPDCGRSRPSRSESTREDAPGSDDLEAARPCSTPAGRTAAGRTRSALGSDNGTYVNHRAPPPAAFLGLEPRPVLAADPPDGL